MFFAAIDKEKRGRSKTVIEGIIKPAAIIGSAILLILYQDSPWLIISTVSLSGWLMFYFGKKIQNTYIRTLTTGATYQKSNLNYNLYSTLAQNLASHEIKDMTALLTNYDSYERDIKRFLVNILLHSDEKDLEALVVQIARKETDLGIMKIIARSCGELSTIPRTQIISHYLTVSKPEVYNQLLLSLFYNDIPIDDYRDTIWSRFILTENPRDKYYAILALSTHSVVDKSWARTYFSSLISEPDTPFQERQYGIMGLLHLRKHGISEEVLNNLGYFDNEKVSHIVDAIFTKANDMELERLLYLCQYFETTKRRIIIKKLRTLPRDKVVVLNNFIKEYPQAAINPQIIEALVALRTKYYQSISPHEWSHYHGIRAYAQAQCEKAYLKASVYYTACTKVPHIKKSPVTNLMEEYLRGELLDAGHTVFNTLVILEGASFLTKARQEFSLYDSDDRASLVELIEMLPNSSLKDILIPILEDSPWKTYSEVGQRFFNITAGTELFFETTNRWHQKVVLLWHYTYFSYTETTAAQAKRFFKQMENKNLYIIEKVLDETTKEGDLKRETLEIVEKIIFFKTIAIFKNVLAKDLVHIAEQARLLHCKPGEIVSRQGDKAVHLFLIYEGTLDIIQNVGQPHSKHMSSRTTGESYGEAGALSRGIRRASAVARDNCTLFVIEYSDLRKAMTSTPSMAESFIRFMGQKILDKESIHEERKREDF